MNRKHIKDKWDNLVFKLKAIKVNKDKVKEYQQEPNSLNSSSDPIFEVKQDTYNNDENVNRSVRNKKRTIKRNKPWYMDAVIILAFMGGLISVGEKAIEYYRRHSRPPTWQVYVIQGAIGFLVSGLIPAIRRAADPDIKSGIRELDKDNEEDED
jgi:hypothetical protein